MPKNSPVDIFISYANEDNTIARLLAEDLTKRGWSIFWDRMIPSGVSWRQHIGRALEAARCVIVLWSQNSVNSNWVVEEAHTAHEGKKLFPIIIDSSIPPIGFNRIHSLSLPGWNGSPNAPGYQALVEHLASILGLSTHTTLTPTSFIARGGPRELMEAKLLIVGFGGVGKTSLARRLVFNQPFQARQSSTDGIAISESSFSIGHDENVRLHIWDFGGQEIMHSTHQFFLTDSSIYLIVINGREGREEWDVFYWIGMLKNFAKDSPIIVVLNKIKQYPFHLNTQFIQQHYNNAKFFVETDCADDTGIERLAQAISHEIRQLPNLRNRFPFSWFEIRDRLEQDTRDYITFDDFRQLCIEYDETNNADQDNLAAFLHRLGVIVNFRDDPRLHDTHVLKPKWLTQGIYAVLTSQLLVSQQGELHINDLRAILPSDQYPISQLPFLVEMMRKFDLCIRFPDDEMRFLIPQALPKDEPPELGKLEVEQGLRFEYRYTTVLPEGLIPRFIVRTSSLSTDQTRWRTGVILRFEGNLALVKADPLSRSVQVYIHGPSEGRRRLLAIIRSDLEQIGRSYAISPQELVPVPDHLGLAIAYQKLATLEKNGISRIHEVFGDDVVELDVSALLDGVDLRGTRISGGRSEYDRIPIVLFVSYSHRDETLREELAIHLKLLQREGSISLWSDRRIVAGAEWKDEIDENLERANVILLLISADFISSEYCWGIELKRAMERHNARSAKVVPIIVRECSWKSAPFGAIQALPSGGRAVTLWGSGPYDRDVPWTDVENGIRKLVASMREDGGRKLNNGH